MSCEADLEDEEVQEVEVLEDGIIEPVETPSQSLAEVANFQHIPPSDFDIPASAEDLAELKKSLVVCRIDHTVGKPLFLFFLFFSFVFFPPPKQKH